jgi:hypothetical protein
MYRTMYLVLLLGFSLSAQTVNITGKVTNQSGKGISGAVVTLISKNLSATTDASGTYSLSGTNAVHRSPNLPGTESISLNKGVVVIRLMKPVPVQIDLFDVRGKLLKRFIEKSASVGEYRFDVMKRQPAANHWPTIILFSLFPFN